VNDSTGRNLGRNEISARKTKRLLVLLAAMFAVLYRIHPESQNPGSQSDSSTRSIHDDCIVSVTSCSHKTSTPLAGPLRRTASTMCIAFI
jgi:hypothetical protein